MCGQIENYHSNPKERKESYKLINRDCSWVCFSVNLPWVLDPKILTFPVLIPYYSSAPLDLRFHWAPCLPVWSWVRTPPIYLGTQDTLLCSLAQIRFQDSGPTQGCLPHNMLWLPETCSPPLHGLRDSTPSQPGMKTLFDPPHCQVHITLPPGGNDVLWEGGSRWGISQRSHLLVSGDAMRACGRLQDQSWQTPEGHTLVLEVLLKAVCTKMTPRMCKSKPPYNPFHTP